MLETDLQSANQDIDFSLGVHAKPSSGVQFLASRASPLFNKNATWDAIQSFSEHWLQSRSDQGSVEGIWLEFDGRFMTSDPPTPNLFFAWPTRHYTKPEKAGSIIPLLAKHLPVPNQSTDVMKRFLDGFPAQAQVTYFGCSLANRSPALRVCTHIGDKDAIAEFLNKSEWPGSGEPIISELDWLDDFVDAFVLVFEVQSTLSPKLGIELYIRGENQFERQKALLHELVRRGLCTETKCDLLSTWSGDITEEDRKDDWPKNLKAQSAMLGPAKQSIFRRLISHVKLTFSADDISSSKAYLWLGPLWLSRDFTPRDV